MLRIKFPFLVGTGTKKQSVIGNGRMLSCIGQKGEIHNIFWHDIAKILGYDKMAEKWGSASGILRESILKHYLDEQKGISIKSKDPVDEEIDISALCLATPFALLPIDDNRIRKFVEKAENALRNRKIGGYGRYLNDSYYGGNPWTLTTLWLALYYIRAGQQDEGKKLLRWCIEYATDSGMLPEQVGSNGEPLSAMPMGWSHAMFVIAALNIQNSRHEQD